jgi:transmembrane sensor
MIANPKDQEQLDREAADWYSRLSRTPIETEELTAFSRWRNAHPEHLAAYNRVEDISRSVRSLRDDPALRAAAQEALRRPRERPAVRRWARHWRIWSSGVAVVGAIAGAVVAWNVRSDHSYSTQVGEISSLRLDDGSLLRLNTDSQVRVRFERERRAVELVRGQAYFEVAHDTARPFIVTAGQAQVRAVGTQFDVHRSDQGVRVVLAEGRVAVTDHLAPDAKWALSPGQGLTLGAAPAGARVQAVNIDDATSWRTGRLTFHDVRLADAVAELNRYTRTKIRLGAGAPADQKVNGEFEAGDLQDFVAAVSQTYDLQVARPSAGVIEMSARPAPT